MITAPDKLKRDIEFTLGGVTYLAEEGHIERTFLGVEDHGLFLFSLTFAFPGSGQGFDLVLDSYDEATKERIGTAFGMQCIKDIIAVAAGDFGSWEDIKGRRLYALRTERYGFIVGIASLDCNRVWVPSLALEDWKSRYGDKDDK